jgi:SAM-dependent methyltransferase
MSSTASGIVRIMENTLAYRLWQAPFAERKLDPIRASGGFDGIRRVLDVGCGPGTNTHHFAGADYLGMDINPGYIADARRRHRREFIVADVTTYTVDPRERFDFILVNSLLHHLSTPDVTRLLHHLSTLLSDDGHVHILDLVLPTERSISRRLARWDRGDHPRPLEEWRRLFSDAFEPVRFEPYALSALGTPLWQMVYFKGRARS